MNRIFLVAIGLGLASLLFFSTAQAADWAPAGAPEGGTVTRVIAGSGRVWAATFTSGLFRSDDGAQSWRRVLGDFPISALTVDPSNPDLLLASGFKGMLRTVDGGRTWTPAVSAADISASAIAFAPSDPRRVYASAGTEIWRSLDRGATWKKIGAPNNIGIFDLAVDPRSPRIVHAAGARVAILLISNDFLISPFIRGKERHDFFHRTQRVGHAGAQRDDERFLPLGVDRE